MAGFECRSDGGVGEDQVSLSGVRVDGSQGATGGGGRGGDGGGGGGGG